MTYKEKLLDPRWQRKRLEILNRDEFTCRFCGDAKSELQIHHLYYFVNIDPWQYDESALITLCKTCHYNETQYRKDADKALNAAFAQIGFSYSDIQILTYSLSDKNFKVMEFFRNKVFSLYTTDK